jgi:hypothetical protein
VHKFLGVPCSGNAAHCDKVRGTAHTLQPATHPVWAYSCPLTCLGLFVRSATATCATARPAPAASGAQVRMQAAGFMPVAACLSPVCLHAPPPPRDASKLIRLCWPPSCQPHNSHTATW